MIITIFGARLILNFIFVVLIMLIEYCLYYHYYCFNFNNLWLYLALNLSSSLLLLFELSRVSPMLWFLFIVLILMIIDFFLVLNLSSFFFFMIKSSLSYILLLLLLSSLWVFIVASNFHDLQYFCVQIISIIIFVINFSWVLFMLIIILTIMIYLSPIKIFILPSCLRSFLSFIQYNLDFLFANMLWPFILILVYSFTSSSLLFSL